MFLDICLVIFSIFVLFFLGTSKKIENGKLTIELSYELRGISILFVVLHHICQRVAQHSIMQFPFLNCVYLFVGLFFFLSGYGNGKSINKQNTLSFKWIFKRIIYLFFFYFFGLLINVLINRGQYETVREVLFDFLTLTYKPFTLWYLKVLLGLYIITFFTDCIPFISNANKNGIVLFVISIIYICICVAFKVPNYWWNSIIAYSLGYLFSEDENRVKTNFLLTLISFFLFIVLFICGMKIKVIQPVSMTCFLGLVVVYTKHFTPRIYIFTWLGKISLGIYLYHLICLTFFQPKLTLLMSGME